MDTVTVNPAWDLQEMALYLARFTNVWESTQYHRFMDYLRAEPNLFLKTCDELYGKRRLVAPGFNFFTATRIQERELSVTRLWGVLLDPHGWHEQGSLFLKPFLNVIEKFQDMALGTLVDGDLSDWRVSLEHPAINQNRIDIFLYNVIKEAAIAIEFKIRASDGAGQLSRYAEWLDDQPAQFRCLVYVTPDGLPPSKSAFHDNASRNKIQQKLVCLSIRLDLMPILRSIVSDTLTTKRMNPHLIEFLHHYLEVCHV